MSMKLLRQLGLDTDDRVVLEPVGDETPEKGIVLSMNPATGTPIAGVRLDTADSYEKTMAEAVAGFDRWRRIPAPVRGQVVREIGNEYRKYLEPLGELVALEVGKIRAEGIGEVQETVDIADFAVGLSRQLYGKTMPSERPEHRMYEQWLPLGPIGVISAFNFPNAVWGWNAMLGAVCGDVTVWKPSLFAPLTAIATNAIAERVAADMGYKDIFKLVIGTDEEIGDRLIHDGRIPLISATGSCRMGRIVGSIVAKRLGRCLLELGGNNAIIVEGDADLDLAFEGIFFGAVGTAGQRCTSTRRLIAHESIVEPLTDRLVSAYGKVTIGDPLNPDTLVGPLINERSVEQFLRAIAKAKEQGGEVLVGGDRATGDGLGGHFVQPTIIRVPAEGAFPIAHEETFAPILYVFSYKTIDEAIAMQNDADQGLSSAIFTSGVRAAEKFLSPAGAGSDCGLAYVNLGTSGAEIGGAFGGEKDTGGGRESGSDSWRQYMRRQTVTINYGESMRLAQGIEFGAS
ncbi:Aldehyde dehydrogenase B [hydrothermal vent metagenome]|uniref:aldehyde dehydrogenase (NAD(+)) n=1 Tax=hydrothermal vent metagenome TaxID=652676 RepID=A0A3B1DTJ0_9ZZZZ